MSRVDILRRLLTHITTTAAVVLTVLAATANAADSIPLAAETNQVDVIATVVSIDLPSRVVVLKSEDGKQSSVRVGDAVQRLDEIKPGDRIKMRYFESVTLELRQHPKGQPVSATEITERAPAGQLPSGQIARQIRGTVEVAAIDLKRNTITLQGPTGGQQTVTAKKPDTQAVLKKLKKGDLIDITYTEALAAEVTKQ
jgi:hypothetical protein